MKKTLAMVMLVVLTLSCFCLQGAGAAGASTKNKILDYEEYSYKKAARNPDDYAGTLVKLTGHVVQVTGTRKEGYVLRVATNGKYDDVIMVYIVAEYAPSYNILDDDTVTIYGETQGEYTYTTVLNSEVTVPLVRCTSIKVLDE